MSGWLPPGVTDRMIDEAQQGSEPQEAPPTEHDLAVEAFDSYLQQPIQTEHVFPPIPDRRFDWCAYRDPEHYLKGYGRSEAEAIEDLETEEEANQP